MPPDQNQPTTETKSEIQQVVERLKSANNVLVTISNNPSVDQFAACIGLTLVLNKLNKHANAVFSGAIPSTIDFLKPEETIEKNTDSLRDFIIALDKSKADKLRYKVENDVVKVFITPYKTHISESDLKFSYGDFNVDAVVALGVHDKSHLDAAILAHGRILHDAALISMNSSGVSKLGSINWTDAKVSSLCEMVADVARDLSPDIFDKQNATALLTGIVAETERYSNEKASPHTMSVAGVLMSAGASSQLVSTKLETPKEPPKPQQTTEIQKSEEAAAPPPEDDGMIEIDHEPPAAQEPVPSEPKQPAESEEEEDYDPASQIEIDEHGSLKKINDSLAADSQKAAQPQLEQAAPKMITQPPSRTGRLTANDQPEEYTSNADPLSQVLSKANQASSQPPPKIGPARVSGIPVVADKETPEEAKAQTLSDIEKSVDSPHSAKPADGEVPELELDETRKAVEKAAGEAEIDAPSPQVRSDMGASSFEDQPSSDNGAQSSTPPPKVPPPPMIPPQ